MIPPINKTITILPDKKRIRTRFSQTGFKKSNGKVETDDGDVINGTYSYMENSFYSKELNLRFFNTKGKIFAIRV